MLKNEWWKTVTESQIKISQEEDECQRMAQNAEEELNEVLPILDEATKALESLNKRDLGEVKSYSHPPPLVEKVMEAVMILKGLEPTWAEAKRQIGDASFIVGLVEFDKDNISNKTLAKLQKYVQRPDFHPEIVGKVSNAARSLCLWVRAIDMYANAYSLVLPKQLRLREARAQLEEKRDEMRKATRKLQELIEKINSLQKEYDEKLTHKEDLGAKAAELMEKLARAEKIIEGLGSENTRWEKYVEDNIMRLGFLPGDCLLAAAFLSYCGTFSLENRSSLLEKWIQQLVTMSLPYSPGFSVTKFLVDPSVVRHWHLRGLQVDAFSVQNAAIITQSLRWPLVIDPQGQAAAWMKSMNSDKDIQVLDAWQSDLIAVLENAIQLGLPVLLEDIQEKPDPFLDHLLKMSWIYQGDERFIQLGDKKVKVHPNFNLYMTAKSGTSSGLRRFANKTTIVDFAMQVKGVEELLLGILVKRERADLEKRKQELMASIATGKQMLNEMEDKILRLLNEAQASILEDETLIVTLHTVQAAALEEQRNLMVSEKIERETNLARQEYLPIAHRASILYFAMDGMKEINTMYQFSMEGYMELFSTSIDNAQKSPRLTERINNVNEYHTYAVYCYVCRALFQRHRRLFGFYMCIKLLAAANSLKSDEYNFLVHGGVVKGVDWQPSNPCSTWLPNDLWYSIVLLNEVPSFRGVAESLEERPEEWLSWYKSTEPEKQTIPDRWGRSCTEIQKMLLMKALRFGRIPQTVFTFISNILGPKFVEPVPLHLDSVWRETTNKTPILFITSPDTDPLMMLQKLAKEEGMEQQLSSLFLGKGQVPVAKELLNVGIKKGHWVYLANCHLVPHWLPQLNRWISCLHSEAVHPNFRLWLGSEPDPAFPIATLQTSIKVSVEAPRGLKANIRRLYDQLGDWHVSRCQKSEAYTKLLFCLCFFHAVLVQRKRFQHLGWNVPHSFNTSDFMVSKEILKNYLDQYDEIPWESIRYMIANICYSGRVNDAWDRRLLLVYANQFFRAEVLEVPNYQLTALPDYHVLTEDSPQHYRDYVDQLPVTDHPDAFGQDLNADVMAFRDESKEFFHCLQAVEHEMGTVLDEEGEQQVIKISTETLEKLPECIDYEFAVSLHPDLSPVDIVLLYEVQEYNRLLQLVKQSLSDLLDSIQGLQVTSPALQEVFRCILRQMVPSDWSQFYLSKKPLIPWTYDLTQRVAYFARWASTATRPTSFWLAAFMRPSAFLTAVLREAARTMDVTVDMLTWEFAVTRVDKDQIRESPEEGIYVHGAYLEGAKWDRDAASLAEATYLEFTSPMPVMHFKPVKTAKKSKRVYTCPCYYYPIRSGTEEQPSFVLSIDLNSGEHSPEHWIKCGTALLFSTDT